MTSRPSRGAVQANWWVILAVSLALMALLVATSGSHSPATPSRGAVVQLSTAGDHRSVSHHDAPRSAVGERATTTTVTTHEISTLPPTTPAADRPTTTTTSPSQSVVRTLPASMTGTTTTTTTAAPSTSGAGSSNGRTQTQGYLDPSTESSSTYAFTGAGATTVSVVWSGAAYLTMSVGCGGSDQSVGGNSAMTAQIPDAAGSCSATISEPVADPVPVSYTVTIAPSNG